MRCEFICIPFLISSITFLHVLFAFASDCVCANTHGTRSHTSAHKRRQNVNRLRNAFLTLWCAFGRSILSSSTSLGCNFASYPFAFHPQKGSITVDFHSVVLSIYSNRIHTLLRQTLNSNVKLWAKANRNEHLDFDSSAATLSNVNNRELLLNMQVN